MATPPAGKRLLGAHSFVISKYLFYLQPVHLQSHQPHPAADAVARQQPPLRVLHHSHHHRQLRRHGARRQAALRRQNCSFHSNGKYLCIKFCAQIIPLSFQVMFASKKGSERTL